MFVLPHEICDPAMSNASNRSVLAGHSLEVSGNIYQFKVLQIGQAVACSSAKGWGDGKHLRDSSKDLDYKVNLPCRNRSKMQLMCAQTEYGKGIKIGF